MALVDANDVILDKAIAGPGITLVEFAAPWCGPCKMLEASLRKIADSAAGDTAFLKVDISVNEAAATRFEIKSTPTLILFRDGEILDRRSGALPGSAITAWLTQHGAPS